MSVLDFCRFKMCVVRMFFGVRVWVFWSLRLFRVYLVFRSSGLRGVCGVFLFQHCVLLHTLSSCVQRTRAVFMIEKFFGVA